MVGREYGDYFFGEGDEGLEPVQTLVQSAANEGFEPEVIDAAACTFLQEGRIADLRCKCAGYGAIWRKQPFNERSNPQMLQTI